MKSFYYNNDRSAVKRGISSALRAAFDGKKPIVCCIGTDAVSGDSLGPIVGTLLKEKLLGKTYVYGTLDMPITAKEVGALSDYLSKTHCGSPVLAVDAALGEENEVGYIKVCDLPIKPGLGVKKQLKELGSASIIAVVESKESKNLLSFVRISKVYGLATAIAEGICEYFAEIDDFAFNVQNSPQMSV